MNLSIRGPVPRADPMAKGFKDPTDVIQPVLPFPLDTPGIATETRILQEGRRATVQCSDRFRSS